MKWFRFYSEFRHDTKLKRMPITHRYAFVVLLCLANDQKERGRISGLDDDDIAFELEMELEDWQSLKAKFRVKGLIEIGGQGEIIIVNWAKRQFASDSSKERVSRHREAKKKRKCNVTETLQKRDVTPSDTDTDPYSDSDPQADSDQNRSLRAPDLNRASEWARGGANLPNEPAQQPQEKVESSSAVGLQDLWQENGSEVEEIFPGEFCEIDSASPPLMPQEAALTSALVQTIIPPDPKPLPEASRRDPFFGKVNTAVLTAAIAAYNQAAPETWHQATPTDRHLLKKLAELHRKLAIDLPDPDSELVQTVGRAAMALRTSKFHTATSFDHRHLAWLLALPERIHEWASKAQSLSDLQQKAIEKEVFQPRVIYRDLQGNEITRGKAIDISLAIRKEAVGQAEIEWMKSTFIHEEKAEEWIDYYLKRWGLL